MSGLLALLLLATPFEEALAKADALAAAAKAAPPEQQPKAMAEALAAYAKAIDLVPRDQKLVPRVRRRRAALLQRAARPQEAIREHDLIVTGRSRRKDKARALLDGALLLEKGGDFVAAEARLARALDEYGDDVRLRARAALVRGRVLERMARPRDAERVYRFIVEKCRDEAEAVISAYDALALLAVARKDVREAHRWLRECRDRFEKRSTRGDRYGAFVGRLLADMKAPAALARAAG
jgi:tetratricopeptide (TPR) repeat protein